MEQETAIGDGQRRSAASRSLELLVVMTIIGILAAIAVPALRDSPKRARKRRSAADLFTFRSVIDQYKGDKGNYPADLRRWSRRVHAQDSRSTR